MVATLELHLWCPVLPMAMCLTIIAVMVLAVELYGMNKCTHRHNEGAPELHPLGKHSGQGGRASAISWSLEEEFI
jgi:hypothetical protein